MCDNGKYFFYFIRLINYNIFELHYSLQKEQTNAAKRYAKTRTKSSVKKWIIVILLIPYYKALQGNASTSISSSLVSFFFALKFFFCFVFFELNIFFKFSNNGIKYFTAECLFSAPFYKVSIKLFTRSAKISQKRFVS